MATFTAKSGGTFSTQAAADAQDARVATLKNPINPTPVTSVINTQQQPPAPVPPAGTPTQKPVSEQLKGTSAYQKYLDMGYSEDQIKTAVDKYSSTMGFTQLNQTPTQVNPPSPTPNAGTTQPDITNQQLNEQTGTVEGVKLNTAAEQATKRPDYFDDSVERLTELQSNLTQYNKLAPQNFTTYDKFKDAFDYNGRSQKQKDVLDSFWKTNQKPSQPDFRASMSDGDIATAYGAGKLTDKDLYDLFTQDPTKYALVKNAIDKNKDYGDANDDLNGTLQATIKSLGIEPPTYDNDWLQKKYTEWMDTPEIKEKSASLETQKGQIKQIDEKIFNMKKTIEEQYAGTGMTSDIVDAIVADKTEALQRQKRTATIAYNADLNIYNNLTSIAKERMDLEIKEEEFRQQEFENSMKSLGFAYDLYSGERGADLEQAKFDYEKLKDQAARKDDMIGKLADVKNAKGQTIGQLMWNPKTKTYDIPVGTAAGGSGTSSSSSGLTGVNGSLSTLLNQYNNLLLDNSWSDVRLQPNLTAQKEGLKAQIVAKYKQAMKLGTLDQGVIDLMNSLLGGGGIFNPTTYNNKAQSTAVETLIKNLGGNVDTKIKAPSTTTLSSNTTTTTKKPDNILNFIIDQIF